MMAFDTMLPRYLDALMSGNRNEAREIARKAITMGAKAEDIYRYLLVPAMVRIQELHREDRISGLIEHMASRINRFITDQVQAQLVPTARNGKTAIVICAEAEAEELGGQVCADILEANGWSSLFLGGGVAEDDLIELIGQLRPELLVVYGSNPSGIPRLREMIERIRDIGASPMMNVMVTGGIFDRVEGLWQEVHADLCAPSPVSVAKTAMQAPQLMHIPHDPLAPKRRRRLVAGPIAVN
jgi:methanogenic corrinoid protein MtbC1